MGLLYLFFIPNSSLFGIKYISYSGKVESTSYEQSEVNKISMTSRYYDVKVVPCLGSTISVVGHPKSFGYVLVKNSKFEINTNLDESGTLNINVTEPYGAAFKNWSYIELRIPKNCEKTLVLKNSKAPTTIDNENLVIDNLYYETNSGDFKFENGSLQGVLDLKLNKAEFTIGEQVSLIDNNVQLELTSGKFTAPAHTFNEVTVNKNTRGVINIKECQKFTEKIESAGGKVTIGNVEYVDIASSDTNVNISTLNGGTIILTQSGKVNINTINGFTAIQTNSGNITVNNANAPLTISSESGNQKILKATHKISSLSTYGDIEIHFSEDAPSYTSSNEYRSLNVKTYNGKITVSGVENISAEVDNSGNGRLYITMRDVIGTNTIVGCRGEVEVKVNSNASYVLMTQSTNNGSVFVNVGELQVGGYTSPEYTETFVNSVSGTGNSLAVTTTSGSLTVTDDIVS